MPKDPQEFAALLGATIIGEVPDVGGGPFGMARLARLMHQRLMPGQGDRPGRPTDSTWDSRPKVPMSDATRRRLVQIAEAMSTPQRQVSPMQVAAQLLEEAVGRVPLGSDTDATAPNPQGQTSPASTQDDPVRKNSAAPRKKSTRQRTRTATLPRRRKT